MGGFTPLQRDVIARLKLDPTELRAGYDQAKQIQASATSEMLAIDAQRQRVRGQLESQFTAANRAQTQERIEDLRSELAATTGAMAGKTAAQKAALAQSADATRAELQLQLQQVQNYNDLITKLNQLNVSYREQAATSKEANAAATQFRSQGIATGVIQNPFTQINSQLSLLAPGLANIQSRLGGILNSLVILGGGLQGASQGFLGMGEAAEGAANGGLEALGGGLAVTLGAMGLVTAAGIAAAVTFTKISESVGKWAQELQLASDKTGIPLRQLQEFQFIGSTVGLSLDDIVVAARRLSVAMVGAGSIEDGGNRTGIVLRTLLGVAKDAKLPFNGLGDGLEAISVQFSKMPDGADKATIAQALFGRSGLALLPYLEKGPAGIAALRSEFEKFSGPIGELSGKYNELLIAQADYEAASKALQAELAEWWLPIITSWDRDVATVIDLFHKGVGGMQVGMTIQGVGDLTAQGQQVAMGVQRAAAYEQTSGASYIRGQLGGMGEVVPLPGSNLIDKQMFDQATEQVKKGHAAPGGSGLDDYPTQVTRTYMALAKAAQEAARAVGATHQVLIQEADSRTETPDQKKSAEESANVGGAGAAAAREMQTAQERLSEAYGKQLSLAQQITAERSKLAAAEKATADAKKNSSTSSDTEANKDLLAAMNEQIQAKNHLNELEKQYDTQEREAAKLQMQITRSNAEQAEAVRTGVVKSEFSPGAIAAMRANALQIPTRGGELPLLQQQLEDVHGDSPEAVAKRSDLNQQILKIQKEITDALIAQGAELREQDKERERMLGLTLAQQAAEILKKPLPGENFGGQIPDLAGIRPGQVGAGPDQALAQIFSTQQQGQQVRDQLDARLISPGSATNIFAQQIKSLEELRKAETETLDSTSPKYEYQLELIKKIDEQLKITKEDFSASIDAGAIEKIGGALEIAAKATQNLSGGFIRVKSSIAEVTSNVGSITTATTEVSINLSKILGNVASSVKQSMDAYKDFNKPGQTGLGKAADVFSSLSSVGEAATGQQGVAGIFSGALGGLSAGAMLGGPIGAAIGTVVGALAGTVGEMKNKKQEQAQANIKQIQLNVQTIMQNYQLQTATMVSTISQLQQQAAQLASSDTGTGKGGNDQQVQQGLSSINAQITQLEAQQKQVLDQFRETIAAFQVPTGVQQYAATLQQIAKTLQDAASAGASATDQANYLNGALTQVARTIGDNLNNEEQQTIGLMLQSVQLAQQRAQIITSSAQQEQSIRAGLGLAPVLTPGQQAEVQIRNLRQQTALQLQQNDQQQAQLQAQLQGQMELFGWTQQDLNATNAKTLLLAQQLDLIKQITSETVQSIQAQMVYFNELASGNVPGLPSGFLPVSPSGVSLPTNYTIQTPAINLNIDGTNLTPAQLATILTNALYLINTGRTQGVSP